MPKLTSKTIRCEGTSRESGERCKNPAEPGRQYCKWHGGRVPMGLNHPKVIKAGKGISKYSKNLPTRMHAAYVEQLNDPDWLQMQDDNALLVARIMDLMDRSHIGDSMALWQKLSAAYKNMQNASHEQRQADALKYLNELGQLINRGLADSYTWKEITQTLEQRRKIVETQRRIDQDKGRNISAERALLWVGAIMQSLSSTLPDFVDKATAAKIQGAIGDDLNRLLMMEPETDYGFEGVVDGRGLPADIDP